MTRTSVAWGLDSFGRAVASALAGRGSAWRLFADASDAPPSVPAALVPVLEELRDRRDAGAIPVVLFAAADETRAATICEAAAAVRTALDACPAGQYEVWLVLFLPGLTTDAARKARAFDLFCDFERSGAWLDGLTALMVQPRQVRLGTREAEHDLPEVELLDVIDLAVTDATVAPAVAAAGTLILRQDYRFAGRRCLYSSAGLRRLEYPAESVVEHLAARFADEVFHRGFCDTGSACDRQGIGRLVAGVVAQAIERANGLLKPSPPVAVASVTDAVAFAADRAWCDSYRKQVTLACAAGQVQASGAIQSVAEWPLPPFLDLLNTSPRMLADGGLFLDVLLDDRAQADGEAVGLPRLEKAFARAVFVPCAERILEASIRRVATELGALEALPRPQGGILEWLGQVAPTLARFVDEEPPGRRAWLRFPLDVLELVLAWLGAPSDHSSACRLLDDLIAAYARTEEALAVVAADLLEQRGRFVEEVDRVKQASRSLRSLLLGRREKAEALERLDGKLADTDVALEAISARLDEARRLLLETTNEIAVPHFARALVTDAAQSACRDLAVRFHMFVDATDRAVSALRASAIVPEPRRRDTTNVATPGRLAILYQRFAGHQPMPAHAGSVLKSVPQPGASYAACRTLADHFLAGAESLLDRVRDFASLLYLPVASLTVMDVLELEGAASAKHELMTELARPGAAAAFSPALVAAHNPPGTSSSHVVWAGEISRRRLAGTYASLFSPDTRFVESDEGRLLQVVSLHLGFPAFALQALADCRGVAGVSSGDDARDLGPR